MRCQTDIAEKLIEKQADYVLAVENNKKLLHVTRLPIISRLLYRLTIQNHVNCSNRQKPTQSMGALKYGVVIYQLVLIHYLMLPAGKTLKVSAWLKVNASSMVKQVPIKDIISVLYRMLSPLLMRPKHTLGSREFITLGA